MMGTKHDTDSDIYGYKKDIRHHQEEDTSRQPCQMPENESLLLSQSIPHNPNSSRISSSPLAEQSPSPSLLPGQNSSLSWLNSSSPLTISSERETSPSTNQEHASSSSSSGGRSPEISDGSVSPESVITRTTSTGQFKSASCSASWMNTNEIVKEGNQLAFNRVVGGAPQRAHIRLKPRHHHHHHHRTKDETKADDISSSDSSSYNHSSPPAIPDLSKLGTQTAEVVLESVESEGSSESCTFFQPTHTVRHHKHNSKKRHDMTSPSDAGIVSSCSITAASQSCLSMSKGSSSGQDASDSGMVSRNSGQRKRSVAGHYQAIKRTSSQCVGDDDYSPITTYLNTIPIHTSDKDMAGQRKRRRFNRTFGALRQCGLLDLTLQTAALMETSQQMQKQIESLRNETKTLHDTMFTFADVQPNFLSTSGAQQVMNQLEEFANTPIMDNRSSLGLDSVLPSISSGCSSDSMSQNSPAGAQTHHLLQGGHHYLAQNAGYPSTHTEAKKQKYGHNSVCSSQTMTSTETGSPTDSDELQKV